MSEHVLEPAPAPIKNIVNAKNTQKQRIVRRPVHGVLLLDKPKGLSSNDALQKVKWLLRAEKAGHTGTLDPLATGLLPLCFGAATKFSQLHLDADKRYEAVLALGVKTSTGDAEGDVLEQRDVPRGQAFKDLLPTVLKQFKGDIEQIPPMHSALKKDGKALYEYARAGIEIVRAGRAVKIYELEGVFVADNAIKIIVKCSKGTYIRTLGEDIGDTLGCAAHLSSLRRIGTGGFDVHQCVSLEALMSMTEAQRLACILPVDALLEAHQRIELDAENSSRFLNGVNRRGDWLTCERVAVYGAVNDSTNVLLGVGRVVNGELMPHRLLSNLDIEQILEN